MNEQELQLLAAIRKKFARMWIGVMNERADQTLHVTPGVLEGMKPLAEECLRQMKWAQHDTLREFVSDDAREVRAMVGRHVLRLAPDDWNA